MNEQPRFYVHPASLERLRYPYLMFNMAEKRRLGKERWFKENWFKHAIIDSGVETFFFKRRMKDYPKYFLEQYKWKALLATRKFGREKVWVTIPDYPDDYEQRLTWEKGKDNVDKTLENIERFSSTDEVEWIYPVQSRYLDRERFIESCKLVKRYNPKIIGIGTVCKTRNVKFIHFCIKKAREIFGKNIWTHAFGPTLRSLPYIRYYIDSFDSSAQFYINGRMVKNREEREKAFLNWFQKMQKILNEPLLEHYFYGKHPRRVSGSWMEK